MEYYYRYTNSVAHPQIRMAGFWGAKVFDALCDVSAFFDLDGTIPSQYQNPQWLAEYMGLTNADSISDTPENLVSFGITRCLETRLIIAVFNDETVSSASSFQDSEVVSERIWVIPGWENRQPHRPSTSTERVRKYRNKKRKPSNETDEATETKGTRETGNIDKIRIDKIILKDSSSATASVVAETGSVFAFQNLWNETKAPEMPAWRESGPKRAKAAKARLSERALEGETGWRAVIARLAKSSFAKGKNDRGWVADPDFLLQPDTATKILEGKYDDRLGSKKRYIGAEEIPRDSYKAAVELALSGDT